MRAAGWAWIATLMVASTASAQSPQSIAPLDFGLSQAPLVQTPPDQVPLNIGVSEPLPAMPQFDKPPILYQWHSSALGHNRLLFEEPRLERQGISRVPAVQLTQSSAAFFSRSLLFPAVKKKGSGLFSSSTLSIK